MNDAVKSRNPYHPDIAVFLIAIPFISAFNYYLTYSKIQLNWFLLLTFTIDTVQGYMAWYAVRKLIFFFDRKLPYEQNFTKRFVIQIISTTILGLLIISLLTEIVSLIARGRTAPLSFYTVDLFIISIWFLAINGFYIGFHFYNQWKISEARRERELKKFDNGIVVKQGKQDIKVSFETVAGFYVDNEYVVVCNTEGRKFYLDQSLDKLENDLPEALFFRVNRQFIVHRQTVSGFKRAENGKLQVMLSPRENFPSEITVSRTKASHFKDWFRPN
jgi:DNA-binding LytR/AlgR family response regulator